MSDIIQVLPDSVANQIAAGEVIQRPASVVKELLENAVDAGSTSIKLIVKDAGKTLIQIIDNGCGMSETDARLSFERHATSKIRKADDLFAIRTKGFRGEALASIAAIAQVELKTRRTEDEIGTRIEIEGSEVKSQEPCSTPAGTSFAVKNLFFNVPARRNFLKSNPVELRHIIDEFQRVALPHPDIAFSMHHNDNELFHLEPGTLRQRIVSIFGKNHNQRLVPVEEATNIIAIDGFIGKPEFAKKTRGEQFFFINNRFIKSPYLNHAMQAAYQEVLPKESYPSYFLMIDIDPKNIDINIHPTKTEIKFEDERSIYAILRSAAKRSLGKFNIAPSLDFEQETSFDVPLKPSSTIEPPTIKVNPDYNPFEKEKSKSSSQAPAKKSLHEASNQANWEKLYDGLQQQHFDTTSEMPQQQTILPDWEEKTEEKSQKAPYQLHNKYIITQIKSGFLLIDQHAAHERILYEKALHSLGKQQGSSQQELFPQTVEFSASDFELVKELKTEIEGLGFELSEFGKNTFVINGIPCDVRNTGAKELLESLIENYKQNLSELKTDKKENLARSLAGKMAIKSGESLTQEEMSALIDELFSCEMPYSAPNGKPTIITFTMDDLEKRFKK